MTNIYNLQIDDELITYRLSVDAHGPSELRESPMGSYVLTSAILMLLEQADVAEWEHRDEELHGNVFLDLIYRAIEDLELEWKQRHGSLDDEIQWNA